MSELWRSESFVKDEELLTVIENFYGYDVSSTFVEQNSFNEEFLSDIMKQIERVSYSQISQSPLNTIVKHQKSTYS